MIDDLDAEQICDLYRSSSQRLVGYAMLCTGGNRADAEDLVDEAFHDLCRQWEKVRVLDNNGRFCWLRRVTRNKAVSLYHKQHRMIAVDPLEDLALLDQPMAWADPAYLILAQRNARLACDLLDRCLAVIHTMAPRLRMALLLRGDGFSSREIGAQLGVSDSTVRGYWAQARNELNDAVGPVIEILDDVVGEETA